MKQEETMRWMKNTYRPTHFISIQLPHERKTDKLCECEMDIKFLMKLMEKELLGRRWSTKFYRFAVIYEEGEKGLLHAHVVLSCPDRDTLEIDDAMTKAGDHYRRLYRTQKAPDIHVEDIYNEEGPFGYCSKQLDEYRLQRIRSNWLSTSETMFDRHSRRPLNVSLAFENICTRLNDRN